MEAASSHPNDINHSSNSGNAASTTHRYGASLLLGVLVVFISRLPSEVWCFFVNDQTWSDLQCQLFYVLANIPLFLCSAFNPWMYAYHNLEMKPIMKRLLKKSCRRVLRPNISPNSHNNDGLSQTNRGSGFLTNWQISVFTTFPRRGSSCHQCSHYRSGSSYGNGINAKVSTSPSIQHPAAATIKMSRSPSQTSALSRSISTQVDYHWQQSFEQRRQQPQPQPPQSQPQQHLQQPQRTFASFVKYNRSKSCCTATTTAAQGYINNRLALMMCLI